MPTEITSAEQATAIALSFTKKHRFFARPLKAVRENDTWLVEIDVGPITTAVAKVKVDAKSREILEYQLP